jgi:autotransporter-associated beta strand protein
MSPAGMLRRLALALCLGLVGLTGLGTAPAARADTILLGAPGGGSGGASALNFGSAPITVANTSLGEAGAHVTSPVTGTIVRWRITTLGTGAFTLHVLRPTSPGPYVEEGSSAGNVVVSGANTFTADLPIQAGDLVAVDVPPGRGVAGHSAIAGSSWDYFSPVLTPGGSAKPAGSSPADRELLLNADLEYTPPADVAPPPPGSSGTGCKKKKKRHRRAARAAKRNCGKRG